MICPPLIRVEKTLWSPSLSVLISCMQMNQLAVAEPPVFRVCTPHEAVSPTLQLPASDAQALMDQLWQCGIRPSEGTGSAGAFAAAQSHLADLRRLVFDDARFKPQQAGLTPGQPEQPTPVEMPLA